MPEDRKNDVAKAFEKTLNSHGFGFQYAVIKEVQQLYSNNRSQWIPLVPEFPIEIQGSGTRIDIILRHNHREIFLICECKRANPAIANWCFARASFTPKTSLLNTTYLEMLAKSDQGLVTGLYRLAGSDNIYQIALEVKTGKPGDQTTKGRGAIEEGATQVCRGLNGLIEFFAQRPEFIPNKTDMAFLPVIFTTANLWTSETDLSTTDLETGKTPIAEMNEKTWIWYDYPQSPGLKHSLETINFDAHYDSDKPNDLRATLYHEFVRRIAIVSPTGIEDFLRAGIWEL